MTEPFDPSVSSLDYLALARERHWAGASKLVEELAWMLERDGYDCGLSREHVATLINPANWSAAVRAENRTPRIFLDAYINQKGNAEINWARGGHHIHYDEDFLPGYSASAQSYRLPPSRGLGELMWWRSYELLVSYSTDRFPVATALLYAHAARLNELVSFLARHITLVGAMRLNFTYRVDGNLTSADFVPTIPMGRLQEMMRERTRRTAVELRAAVSRLPPID
jgi:hypothetical protein